MTLRFELHALTHAYRLDLDDKERYSFHEANMEFYYNKYFKKTLNLKQYGVSTVLELLRLVEDTVEAGPKNFVLVTHLSDDTPMANFVRLAEDGRRERLQAIDAGDESLVLKFIRASSREREANRSQQQGGRAGGYGGYSGGKGPPPAIGSVVAPATIVVAAVAATRGVEVAARWLPAEELPGWWRLSERRQAVIWRWLRWRAAAETAHVLQ